MGRLLEEFDNHIEELKQLDERIQRKVEKLEQQCHREAKEFAHKVQDLQRSNQVNTKTNKEVVGLEIYLKTFLKCYNFSFLSTLQVAFQHFQELDEHISYVATKVCHLGDQLEGVNTPRQRAVEAQRLMTYFNEFLDGDLRSDVFNNPEKVKIQHDRSKLGTACISGALERSVDPHREVQCCSTNSHQSQKHTELTWNTQRSSLKTPY